MEEGKNLSHGENEANLSLMRQLDEPHMTYPAWGLRKLTAYLQKNGVPKLNAKRLRRFLRMMGVVALTTFVGRLLYRLFIFSHPLTYSVKELLKYP